jgi:hypothetical protein
MAPGQGLAYDLDRIAESREQLGWTIDELETKAALEDTLASVCKADSAEQAAAQLALSERLTQAGGPSKAQWHRGQRTLSKLAPSLRVEHSLKLLESGISAQKRGACPLWWEPQTPYTTQQDPMGRWMLGIETGGRGYAQLENGVPGAGGGGAGRLLLGPVWNRRWAMLGILELGGAGRFGSFDLGEPLDVPDLLVMPAALLHLRRQIGSYFIFAETGALIFVSKEEPTPRTGLRTALGAGLARIKVGPLLPTLGAFVGYDRIGAGASGHAIDQVYVGLNAGFFWMR